MNPYRYVRGSTPWYDFLKSCQVDSSKSLFFSIFFFPRKVPCLSISFGSGSFGEDRGREEEKGLRRRGTGGGRKKGRGRAGHGLKLFRE